MIFRMLIQKYSILYYIYITAVINIIYWIFLITILTYTKFIIIKYTLYSIIKAQDTRSINICQIFFSRFNDLFKTRPSSIGQKYNICISLHVNYFNFSYNINFNI